MLLLYVKNAKKQEKWQKSQLYFYRFFTLCYNRFTMNIKEKLISGNNRFIKNINSNHELKDKVNSLKNEQSPYALIVTCSDSRVVPELIFDTSLGELFVIRSAGNVINEGELASIEYGLNHLNIKCVIVLAHTHCGAVHASIHKGKGEYLSCILDNISEVAEPKLSQEEVSFRNASKQVNYILEKFPLYDGEIYPALYDIETGKVVFGKR